MRGQTKVRRPPLLFLLATSQKATVGHHIFRSRMLLRAKAVSILLLMLAVSSISSASLLSLPSVQGQATGCPMHRQSSPLHSPIDHRCCQSEHDAAVLQKPANPKPDVVISLLLRLDPKPVPQGTSALFQDEAASPGTPPAKLQLRI